MQIAEAPRVNELTGRIIEGAIKVHKALGPGLLESAYLACLLFELRRSGLEVQHQRKVPVNYDDVQIDCGYKLDLVVQDLVVVELKSVEQLAPIHTAQILTYLKLTGYPVGLLINFNVPLLKYGIKRLLNPDPRSQPKL
jgi:GxxExxY protein